MVDDHKTVRLLDDLPPIRGFVPGKAKAVALPDGEIIEVLGMERKPVLKHTKADVFPLGGNWWFCGEVR